MPFASWTHPPGWTCAALETIIQATLKHNSPLKAQNPQLFIQCRERRSLMWYTMDNPSTWWHLQLKFTILHLPFFKQRQLLVLITLHSTLKILTWCMTWLSILPISTRMKMNGKKKKLSTLGNFVHFDILAKSCFPTGKSMMEPDGTILCQLRSNLAAALCFTKLKNEIGEGGCDPMRQAEIDYVCFYLTKQERFFLLSKSCVVILF